MFKKIQSFIVGYLERLFCIYHIVDEKNSIYLTFDDGPEEVVTEKILAILEKYNAKATFFCCGHNIVKNEYLYNETSIFRPPYMSLSLIECIVLLFLTKIILWDIDSEDWCTEKEDKIDVEDMIIKTKPGSIVLFHFSQEHMARTLQILPLYMKGMSERGYVFKSISNES